MSHLRHMTNEQLRFCLLDDMKSYLEGSRVLDDDNVDETVSTIEEVFLRIHIYSTEDRDDRHALSNKLITNALKRGV